MAPPFIYRVDELRQNQQCPPRHRGGDWQPPRPLGSNRITEIGRWLCHTNNEENPNMIAPYPSDAPPPRSLHFATYSMYYSNGSIWAVPFDASRHPVGSGLQNDDDDDSSDSDTDEEQSDRNSDNPDWSQLSFNYHANNISFATVKAEHRRLQFDRPDQMNWIDKLLPDRYHAQKHDIGGAQTGGMTGILPVLLGLIAMSVEPRFVTGALQTCVTTNPWAIHGHPKGHGRIDERGVVVRTYVPPNPDVMTAAEDLQFFERGGFGAIYS